MGRSTPDHITTGYTGFLADRVSREMKKQKITQQALADRLGVRKATVNEFLNGKPSTAIGIAEAAAKAVGANRIDVF